MIDNNEQWVNNVLSTIDQKFLSHLPIGKFRTKLNGHHCSFQEYRYSKSAKYMATFNCFAMWLINDWLYSNPSEEVHVALGLDIFQILMSQ